jgi:hypothetical protein
LTFGFRVADMQREFSVSHIRRLSDLADDDLVELLRVSRRGAATGFEREGFAEQDRCLSFQFGMRYHQQGFEFARDASDPFSDAELTRPSRNASWRHTLQYGFDLELEPEPWSSAASPSA